MKSSTKLPSHNHYITKSFNYTWVTWGAGQVPVGYSSDDSDFGTIEATGGAKTVTLNVSQIPSHSHSMRDCYYDQSGNMPIGSGAYSLSVDQGKAATYATGGGQPHTNLQPYRVCFFWKRTA